MLGIMEINYPSGNTVQISLLTSRKNGHGEVSTPQHYIALSLKTFEQQSSAGHRV